MQQTKGNCCFIRRKNLSASLLQEYIAEALLLLMKKKSYSNITIGEITTKAGVNRSSYYRHFETKEDIIRFYLLQIMNEYLTKYQQSGNPSFYNYTLQIFLAHYQYKENLLLIYKSDLSYLLLDVLNSCFRFSETPDITASKKQFEVAYHIGGIYNNMLLWFHHNMKETPEQMTDITLSFRPEGSFTLLDVDKNA